MVRTGYENIVPHRVGKLYSFMAKQDGKVIDITPSSILVEYKDGTREGCTLGRQIGKAEGSFYAHDILTPLKPNQKFKQGDPIAYNSQFFEPDMLDPSKIIMKMSLIGKVAFMETSQTLEDACSITPNLSARLQTNIVKEKVFIINFNQNIRNLLPAGKEVTPKDILFILEDEVTSGLDVFDNDTIEALARLSNLAPKAKMNGMIDHYEVYYNGDIEDMSPSLRKITNESNKQLWERTKYSHNPIKNGQVNEEYRVEGKALQLDTLVLKVYLVAKDHAELGDKTVFANQLKSICSEVLSYPVQTEDGENIDAIFSYKSIANRIVNSPITIGTTITLLNLIAKNAVSIYEK